MRIEGPRLPLTVWLRPKDGPTSVRVGLAVDADGYVSVALDGQTGLTPRAAEQVAALVETLSKAARMSRDLHVLAKHDGWHLRVGAGLPVLVEPSDNERDRRADHDSVVLADRDHLASPVVDDRLDLLDDRRADRVLVTAVDDGEHLITHASPSVDGCGDLTVGDGPGSEARDVPASEPR